MTCSVVELMSSAPYSAVSKESHQSSEGNVLAQWEFLFPTCVCPCPPYIPIPACMGQEEGQIPIGPITALLHPLHFESLDGCVCFCGRFYFSRHGPTDSNGFIVCLGTLLPLASDAHERRPGHDQHLQTERIPPTHERQHSLHSSFSVQ